MHIFMIRFFLAIVIIFLLQKTAFANPNQFGSSGLLNVPSADTLDSANFCFGVWGNCNSKATTGITSIMPVTLTLGIGTFWEIYGTYPNVYLNDEAPYSGRGTADIGTKIRFYGSRSSKFKISADMHMSRYVDYEPNYNGKTDIGGGLIASLRSDLLAAHLYSGFMSNGQSRQVVNGSKGTNEYPVAGGLEFSPTSRTKTTLELMVADAAKAEAPIEVSVGFQYYLTPHLTFNLSYGMGLNAAAADWRVMIGLVTCQGVGTYIKPIPVVTRKDQKGAKSDLVKPFKVIPLSPLLIMTPALITPVSKFEVPLDAEGDEILVRPYSNAIVTQQPVLARPVTIPDSEPQTQYIVTKVSSEVTAYRKFRIQDNLFEFDSSEMIPEVQKSIAELAEFIRNDKKWVFLRVDGHTDGVGSDKYNQALSLKRAISVANYLITREGIDPARIFVRGMGKSMPIADNSTDEGRKLNRRFEIFFLINKEDKSK